jgi:hypothetical protein
LPNKLIHARFLHAPQSFSVPVKAMVSPGRSAIDLDAKANGAAYVFRVKWLRIQPLPRSKQPALRTGQRKGWSGERSGSEAQGGFVPQGGEETLFNDERGSRSAQKAAATMVDGFGKQRARDHATAKSPLTSTFFDPPST